MTYDWGKCPFTAAELKGKRVAIRIPVGNKDIYDGEAMFDAVQDHRGLVRMAVLFPPPDTPPPPGVTPTLSKIFVPVEAYAQIVRNPSGSKCEFSLRVV